MITIKSIQIGTVRTEGDPQSKSISDRLWTSAFDKRPVNDIVQANIWGIIGDQVADTKNHGGPDKAILCYAASHYPRWQVEHPTLPMKAGGLGENLTLDGADENSVCIGDEYVVGDDAVGLNTVGQNIIEQHASEQHVSRQRSSSQCRIQVSQPRQPCWKIARRWQTKTLTKEVAQTGRTGWYVRVLEEGQLQVGDELKLAHRPNPDWTVARANDLLFGREIERLSVIQLMNLPELADDWKNSLA